MTSNLVQKCHRQQEVMRPNLEMETEIELTNLMHQNWKKKTLLQPQRYSVLFNVDCLVIFKDTVQNVDMNQQI